MERDRIVLEHVLLLLVSLAGLADRAASASLRQRIHVLDLLGPGEAAARELIAAMARGSHFCDLDTAMQTVPPDAWRTKADARRLAATFRVLALALFIMLDRIRPAAQSSEAGVGAVAEPGPFGATGRRLVAALPPPDTS